MNRIYKVIWSKVRHCYVVVSELAKKDGKSVSTRARVSKKMAASLAVMALCTGMTTGVMAADTATGTGSGVAYGTSSEATKATNTAIGPSAKATGREQAVAVGNTATASDAYSTAVGSGANATASFATAIGYKAAATGSSGTALGNQAEAGYLATALGKGAKATGSTSIAVSDEAEASGKTSMAIGNKAKASGGNSIAIGVGANSSISNAIAIGLSTVASGSSGVAVGNKTEATGGSSSAFGVESKATASESTAIGYKSTTASRESLSMGRGAIIGSNADRALAMGYNAYIGDEATPSTAVHDNGVAVSGTTKDTAQNYTRLKDTIAIGAEAKAYGYQNIAMGAGANAFNNQTVAIGRSAEARGDYSSVLGYKAAADGKGATALGFGARAYGRGAVAIGQEAITNTLDDSAEVEYSVAIGNSARAASNYSVALGSLSLAVIDDDVATKAYLTDETFSKNNGVVSVGNKAYTLGTHEFEANHRRITNVAGGADDYDAVNVAQLKKVYDKATDNTTKISQLSGGWMLGVTTAPDVRQASDATAEGVSRAISVGQMVSLQASNGIRLKQDGTNVQIGLKFIDMHTGGYPVNDAKASGGAALAVGQNSVADGMQSTAVGFDTYAGQHSFAGGNQAEADMNSVALGAYAKAKKQYSVAIGISKEFDDGSGTKTRKKVDSDYGMALGTYSYVGEDSKESNAIGFDTAITNSVNSTAVGSRANIANSKEANSFGYLAKVTDSEYGSAFGSHATVTNANNAVALGVSSKVEGVDSGVALGAFSVADKNARIFGYDPSTGMTFALTQEMQDALTAWQEASKAAVADPDNADKLKAAEEAAKTYRTLVGAWESQLGAVSVGDSSKGVTRQITNVAAGTLDTDAVNVAQLKAVNTKVDANKISFFSVNPEGFTVTSNEDNKGATGAHAMAIGIDASATGLFDTAIGKGAAAADGDAIAIGSNSKASGGTSTAIGERAEATSSNTIALGSGSKATDHYGIAIGAVSKATNLQTVAIGAFAEALEEESIAIGYFASASEGAYGGVAVGRGAGVTSTNGLALGRNAIATMVNGIALGSFSVTDRDGNYLGYDPNVGGDFVFTAEMQAAMDAANEAIYERNQNPTPENDQKALEAIKKYKLLVAPWVSGASAVSIGNKEEGLTRQITNVAAGSTDTDAVNVAQLKALDAKVTKAAADSALTAGKNIEIKTTTDDTTGVKTNTINLKDKITLGDTANEAKQVTIDGNAATVTAGTGDNKVVVDGSSGQVVIGDTGNQLVIGKQADTATDKDGNVINPDTQGNYITGLDNTTWDPEKNGIVENRAATEGQLRDLAGTVGDISDGIKNATRTITGDGDAKVVLGKDDALSLTGGADTSALTEKNIAVVNNGDKGFSVKLSSKLTGLDSVSTKTLKASDSITVGSGDTMTVISGNSVTTGSVTTGDTILSNDGLTIKDGPSVTKDGIDAGGKTISNIGEAKSPTDAINKSTFDTTVNNIGSGMNQLGNQINKLDNRVDRVGAGAAALAALHPLEYDPTTRWEVSAGIGNYHGANAVAVGAFYRPNYDTLVSIGSSYGGGENMVNAGVTWRIGEGGSGNYQSKGAMAQEINDLRSVVDEQNSKLASQSSQIESQSEQLSAQSNEIKAQRQQLEEQNKKIEQLMQAIEDLKK
ncbi:ESPR-type extended signal peptide-containing protein [Megasphaera massiliensis]|uniref:ESPR-type extended signal peptide-containing protein n=1 Tax=Megasphaera massiliensis TaxID=1232428 RepID=UPI0036F4341B